MKDKIKNAYDGFVVDELSMERAIRRAAQKRGDKIMKNKMWKSAAAIALVLLLTTGVALAATGRLQVMTDRVTVRLDNEDAIVNVYTDGIESDDELQSLLDRGIVLLFDEEGNFIGWDAPEGLTREETMRLMVLLFGDAQTLEDAIARGDICPIEFEREQEEQRHETERRSRCPEVAHEEVRETENRIRIAEEAIARGVTWEEFANENRLYIYGWGGSIQGFIDIETRNEYVLRGHASDLEASNGCDRTYMYLRLRRDGVSSERAKEIMQEVHR